MNDLFLDTVYKLEGDAALQIIVLILTSYTQ